MTASDSPTANLPTESQFAPPQTSSKFPSPEKPVIGVEAPANK